MKHILQTTAACALTAVITAHLMRNEPPPVSDFPPAKARLRVAEPRTVSSAREASADTGPLLPPPVLPSPAATASQPSAPAVPWLPGNPLAGPPAEESLMSAWAAKDPEGAGNWLNRNRDHPQFADYVRGYAIQIATIDPNAARQWAAQIPAGQNRFAAGGTLEQHIDAIEQMLNPSAANPPDAGSADSPPRNPISAFLADYRPVLVRQRPGEEPVLEMQAVSPFQ